MIQKPIWIPLLALLLVSAGCMISSDPWTRVGLTFSKAPPKALSNMPVHTVVELPEEFVDHPPENIAAGLSPDKIKEGVPGQIIPLGGGKAEVWWIQQGLQEWSY